MASADLLQLWSAKANPTCVYVNKDLKMIQVSVNGEMKVLAEGLNVSQMIEALAYKTKGFAVAVNTTFVSIQTYEKTIINNGDTIDILAPVQGG